MSTRRFVYMSIVSTYTAINLFLLGKLHVAKNIRENYEVNYMDSLSWQDLILFLGLFILCFGILKLFIQYIVPLCRERIVMQMTDAMEDVKTEKRLTVVKIFLLIGVVWGIFFLAFYPGTAMNDTIYILKNPWYLSRQHPILYNLYLYGFYKMGVTFGNPNMGLVLISIVQMIGMDYVLAKGIIFLHRTFHIKAWVCVVCALFFAFSPVYFTYAFSAIKDTPYSICLFGLMLLIAQAMQNRDLVKDKIFLMKMLLCMVVVASFRSNGIVVCVLLLIGLFCLDKGMWGKTIFLCTVAVLGALGITFLLTRDVPKPYFQEKVGIQLQQIAAVLNRTDDISEEDKIYLYQVLPQECWKQYAPACSDVLKWNKEFDREYLNDTQGKFMLIWCRYLPKHIWIYSEAYLLNTYGFWGIETRNSEQYYVKDIYQNELGLEQKSILPKLLHDILYKYYCNRYTYGYMSYGSLLWILFLSCCYALYVRKVGYCIILLPAISNSVSVFLSTPIAFCFRYVFILALVIPFIILTALCISSDAERM